MCFFSCHHIISYDRIYVERMFWGPPDRFSSPTEKIIAKTIIRICPFRQILSCSNLPTSSVELIWPITELYFRQILSTDFMNRFCQDVKTGPNTRYYGDKILSKNLDLTQDFPNKILFHSLWEQNLVQNLPKIFRLPEIYSFGKILAQDFQMAAITKILMRRENQLRRFFPWGMYVCMYVCMVITYSRVWINRVRLPILLVVS